jgi:small subunit ribosomal protein S8
MTMTDPIADFLTRLRNANSAYHDEVTLPHSKIKANIAGLRRVSKPGLRVYAKSTNLPRVLGGLGVAIISTSSGLKTDRQAARDGVGGEVLAYVW